MAKRSKLKYDPDPHQWYREPPFPVEQLFNHLDFGGSLIWDPACGVGNILNVAKAHGHQTIGSDIIDRKAPHRFFRANFLLQSRFPAPLDRPLSIICNPPYGTVEGIGAKCGEKFVERVLELVPFYRAAFLMPIEFLTGQTRYWQIYSNRAPSHALICTQRPSMPPGTQVEAMGAAAFTGGTPDYCWVVWTRGGPYRTELIFMRPNDRDRAPPATARRIRN